MKLIQVKEIFKILFVLFLLQINANLVLACSCTNDASIEYNIKLSDVVVLAKILKIDSINVANRDLKKGTLKIVILKVTSLVEEKFKGKFRKKYITIYTSSERGSCGFQFEVGELYTIFGYKKGRMLSNYDFGLPNNKSSFWTDVCTRTQKYNTNEHENIKKIKTKY
jgi:hypothetical protein